MTIEVFPIEKISWEMQILPEFNIFAVIMSTVFLAQFAVSQIKKKEKQWNQSSFKDQFLNRSNQYPPLQKFFRLVNYKLFTGNYTIDF